MMTMMVMMTMMMVMVKTVMLMCKMVMHDVEDGDVESASTFPRDSSAWLDVCLQADLELSQGR